MSVPEGSSRPTQAGLAEHHRLDRWGTGSDQRDRVARVLMVGAYERDNFGDLLFLLVTERYLADAQVFSTAPFGADMSALMDREVHAYGPLLRAEAFDAIWTVGGQVGGTDLRSAFRMSASSQAYRRFEEGSDEERAEILRDAVGGIPGVSPYIPSPLAYPRNASAISVLNSVGLDGIRGARPDRRAELITLLRGQTFISVRDKPSSDYLSSLGIEHRLAPDAVHAVALHHPAEPDPDSDVAIVQVSAAVLGKLGHANVAARIARSHHLRSRRIRLLLAGIATGHDSVGDYLRLVDHVHQASPAIDIEVLESRRPFDLVDQIARAKLVVSTSLHVRIIACAYGVPRVTLARAKPTKYAQTWDPDMPFGVALDDLDGALERASANAARPDVVARSAELSHLAHENLDELTRGVMALARDQSQADKARRLALRREHQVALLTTRNGAQEREIARLGSEIDRLTAGRRGRSRRLAARAARAWRALRSVR